MHVVVVIEGSYRLHSLIVTSNMPCSLFRVVLMLILQEDEMRWNLIRPFL